MIDVLLLCMRVWFGRVELTKEGEIVLARGTGGRIEISLIGRVDEKIDGMI